MISLGTEEQPLPAVQTPTALGPSCRAPAHGGLVSEGGAWDAGLPHLPALLIAALTGRDRYGNSWGGTLAASGSPCNPLFRATRVSTDGRDITSTHSGLRAANTAFPSSSALPMLIPTSMCEYPYLMPSLHWVWLSSILGVASCQVPTRGDVITNCDWSVSVLMTRDLKLAVD